MAMYEMMGAGCGAGIVIGWVLLLAVLVGGAVLLLRAVRGTSGRAGEAPLEVLRRRYAAGELSRDEFDRMREDITRA
jgi:putative membrane protein